MKIEMLLIFSLNQWKNLENTNSLQLKEENKVF